MKDIEEKTDVINKYKDDIKNRIIELIKFYPKATRDIENAKEYQFPKKEILGKVLEQHEKEIYPYVSYRPEVDKKINELNHEIQELQRKFKFNKDYSDKEMIKKDNTIKTLDGELLVLMGKYANTKKKLAGELSKYYEEYEVKVDDTDKKKVDDAIKTINENEESGINNKYEQKLNFEIQKIKYYNELLKAQDQYIELREIEKDKIISDIFEFIPRDVNQLNMRTKILELLKFPNSQKTIILRNAENIANLPTDVDDKTRTIKMAYDPMAPTRALSGLPLGPYVSRFQQLDDDGNDIHSSDFTNLLNPFSAARDARAATGQRTRFDQRQGLAQLDPRVFPNPPETSPSEVDYRRPRVPPIKAGRRRPAAGRSAVPLYGKPNDEDDRVTPRTMEKLADYIGARGGYKPPSSKYQKTKKNRKEKIKHKQTNKKQKKNKKNIILTKTSKIYSKSRKNNKKNLKHKTSLHNIR